LKKEKDSLYLLHFFVLSFVIMGLEMMAIRLLTPHVGNTLSTWAILISVFLVSSSFGYFFGGNVADYAKGCRVVLIYYGLGIALTAVIFQVEASLFALLQHVSYGYKATIGTTGLFFLPIFLFSAVITALTKEGLQHKMTGKRIGGFHAVSAVGSVAGTLVTTFLLIPTFTIQLVVVVFLIMLLVSFGMLLVEWGSFKKESVLLIAALSLFFVFPIMGQEKLEDHVVYNKTSAYHTISVVRGMQYHGEKSDYFFLSFGGGGIQSAIDRKDPDRLVLFYARGVVNMIKTFVPDYENVFLIGHGGGTLTTYFEKEGKKVVAAELDPDVVQVSRDFFDYKGNSVIVGDGRSLLKAESSKKDLIMLDAFHHTYNIPFHLVTKEFFQETLSVLHDDGMLVVNAIGSPGEDSVLSSIITTIHSVYPHVGMYKNKEKGTEIQNILVAASRKKFPEAAFPGLEKITMSEGEIIRDHDTKYLQLR
jgi:predicted membrane-bound spermidine synthase